MSPNIPEINPSLYSNGLDRDLQKNEKRDHKMALFCAIFKNVGQQKMTNPFFGGKLLLLP